MDTLLKDVRFALRTFLRRPGFSAVIVLSLALAIGANTAIFSIVNAVALRGVDVADPDRVVALYTTDEKNPGRLPTSDLNALDLREATSELMDVAFFRHHKVTINDGGGPTPLTAMVVSGNYFRVLGVDAAVGRTFDHDDAERGAHQELVIGHRLWQERFGGDPGVVGRRIVLGEAPVTIVGVTPEGFGGTMLQPADAFIPYSAHRELLPDAPYFEQRRFLAIFPVARLHPGVSAAQVDDALAQVGRALARDYPVVNEGRTFVTVPLAHALVGPDQRDMVLAISTLLMTVIAFVLLIACANAANLMLARAASRRAEIAMRRVLGATRGRIVRQMLTESLLLAGAAALLGLVLAVPMRDFVWSLRPQTFAAPAFQPQIDGTVLAYLVGLTAATGLLFGLAPALRAAGVDLMTPLKEETTPLAATTRRLSLRSALVVLQVVLSTVALVGAGLFWTSMQNARAVELGFDAEGLVLMDVDLRKVDGSPAVVAARRHEVVQTLEALPEVERAAVSSRPPLTPQGLMLTLTIDDHDIAADDGMLFTSVFATPGLFETLGQPLLEGRDFRPGEGEDETRLVVIVNETFARRYWPERSAIGRSVTLTFNEVSAEIIGVVADAKVALPTEAPKAVVWLPMVNAPQPVTTLVVRTHDPEAALPLLRSVVDGLGEDVMISNVRPASVQIEASLFGPRAGALLLGTFGALALGLAAIGIYGVMTYSVRQRTREIGIRMALGARPADVRRFVLLQAMGLVVAGIGLGIAGGLLVQDALSGLLFEVGPADPVAYGGATVAMALLALGAGWLPARDATRIQPTAAMRDV